MNFKQLAISLATLIVKIIVGVMIVKHAIVWAGTAYDFGFRVFTEAPMTGEPGITYSVTLTEETTPKQLANALKEEGLIRDEKLFMVQYMVSEHKDHLVPGKYELNTSMTAEQMLTVMAPTGEDEEGDS